MVVNTLHFQDFFSILTKTEFFKLNASKIIDIETAGSYKIDVKIVYVDSTLFIERRKMSEQRCKIDVEISLSNRRCKINCVSAAV